MKTPTYLSCAETAKLVRAALKKSFPGVKFSVRSDVYAGGASIDVKWTDGPTTKQVDAIVGVYAGGRFDGMIDMKISVQHWLMPDGSVAVASNPGTTGSGGVIQAEREWMPDPEAKLVRFGADYVFTNRDYSPDFLRRRLLRIADECNGELNIDALEIEGTERNAWVKNAGSIRLTGRWEGKYLSDAIWQNAAKTTAFLPR